MTRFPVEVRASLPSRGQDHRAGGQQAGSQNTEGPGAGRQWGAIWQWQNRWHWAPSWAEVEACVGSSGTPTSVGAPPHVLWVRGTAGLGRQPKDQKRPSLVKGESGAGRTARLLTANHEFYVQFWNPEEWENYKRLLEWVVSAGSLGAPREEWGKEGRGLSGKETVSQPPAWNGICKSVPLTKPWIQVHTESSYHLSP